MSYWLLQAFTAARLFVLAPLWLWCWWRRPRGMVAWMALAAVGFLLSDHFDGQWARRYGLESRLGFWLDHLGDVAFYGAIVFTTIRGSREPGPRRRRGPPSGDVGVR